jgi:hypothetical protein
VLDATPGLHRFVWDLRTEDPLTLTYGYFGGKLDYIEYTLPDHSIPGQTPRQQPPGALIVPGTYQAVITVDGKKYQQKLDVVLDPRVHASAADLTDQWTLANSIGAAMAASYNAYNEFDSLRIAITQRQAALKDNPQAKDRLDVLAKLQKSATEIGEGSDTAPGVGPMNRDISRYFVMVESADIKPGASAHQAASQACVALQKNLDAWRKLNQEDLAVVNKQLESAKLAALPAANGNAVPLACAP